MFLSAKKLQSLRKDERGNVAIIFGLVSLSVVMITGGALEFGNAYSVQHKLQLAADAGAMAGAAMDEGTSETTRQTMANNVFQSNVSGFSSAPIIPITTVDGSKVMVSASTALNTSLLRVINIESLSVAAASKAEVVYVAPDSAAGYCLLALDPSATHGLKSQGTPNVAYPECWAHTNSTLVEAIDGGGSAVVTGAGHSAVGGISASAVGVYSPAPTGGANVVNDPFATVGAYAPLSTPYQSTFTPPAIPNVCKANNLSLKKGSFTLEPGRYCGGINLQAGATVTLSPGVFIIDDGLFNVQSGSSVTGSNVLLYFKDANARMTIIGGGTVNLKGRQSGSSYAGFLMIAHPDAYRNGTSNIQGGGSFKLEGMVYMPTQNILITGNGDSNGSSHFFAIVAKSLEFRGNGIFNLKTHNTASNMPNIMPQKSTVGSVANVSLK